jgi:hypothetical protein
MNSTLHGRITLDFKLSADSADTGQSEPPLKRFVKIAGREFDGFVANHNPGNTLQDSEARQRRQRTEASTERGAHAKWPGGGKSLNSAAGSFA